MLSRSIIRFCNADQKGLKGWGRFKRVASFCLLCMWATFLHPTSSKTSEQTGVSYARLRDFDL